MPTKTKEPSGPAPAAPLVPFELQDELPEETVEKVKGHAKRRLYNLADRAVDLLEEASDMAYKVPDKLAVSSAILEHIGLGPQPPEQQQNTLQIPADTLFQGLVTLGKVFGMASDAGQVHRAAENMRNVTAQGSSTEVQEHSAGKKPANIQLNAAIEAVRSASGE